MDGLHIAETAAPEPLAEAGRIAAPRHARHGPSTSGARRRRTVVVVLIVYAVCGLPAYLPGFPGDPNRLTTACGCQDSLMQSWFLAWTPFSIGHGLNPLTTTWIEVPHGANLMLNTSAPLLGALGAPLTVAVNAVATMNLWLFLAFPLSATACFVLLRRWVDWTPAAMVGGLVYGFSPYLVAQASGHLNLVMVPIPPLVLLTLDELVVRQRRRPIPVGVALGVLGAAQYLIATEVFAATAVLSLAGVALVALAHPRSVVRRWRHALKGVTVAAVVCLALTAYPLSVQLGGPDRFTGSAHGTYPFPADLLATVVPSVHQLLAPASALGLSNGFILGDTTENGSYLGIPLLVALVALVVWRWRHPLVRIAAAMAVVAELLSLGPTLTINGHATGIALPDRLLDHLPQFTSFLDARFSLYVDLFCAVLVGVGLAELRRRWPATRRWMRVGVPGAVAVVTLLPLLPAWPYASSATDVPPLFSSAVLARDVPPGSVALTYPYPEPSDARAMVWQAAAGMRFRLIGGYALEPGPTGTASFDPFPPSMDEVPATFVADEEGVPPPAVLPGTAAATAAQTRRFLRRYRVDTVVVERVGARPQRAVSLLRAAIGRAPLSEGGVDVWFHLDPAATGDHRRPSG